MSVCVCVRERERERERAKEKESDRTRWVSERQRSQRRFRPMAVSGDGASEGSVLRAGARPLAGGEKTQSPHSRSPVCSNQQRRQKRASKPSAPSARAHAGSRARRRHSRRATSRDSYILRSGDSHIVYGVATVTSYAVRATVPPTTRYRAARRARPWRRWHLSG